MQYCSVDGTRLSKLDSRPPSACQAGPEPGSVLGDYRLLGRIGAGGMSLVYAAEHTRLGRRVAIKLLRCEHAANPIQVKRFFQEARTVNTIRHEHIVEITDFIEQPGGDNYYVMELLEGRSLTDLEKQLGPLPIERVVGIAVQICRAVAAAHAVGVVHRDLKPDNIFLLERAGQPDYVKLLDFGVAKLIGDQAGKPMHQTAAGAILGTPAYMSMEQASGRPVDFRTDLYSLGIILYEMLSGLRPFTADTFGGLLIQHLTVDPPGLSELADLPQPIPPALENLILQCLSKEAADRPASMNEVADRLLAVSPGSGVRSVGRAVGDPGPSARSGWVRWIGWGLLAGMILAGAVWGVWRWVGPAPLEPVTGAGQRRTLEPALAVKVTFESSPPGAQVFEPGRARPLGETPFTAPLAVSAATRTFEFRLAAHRTARQTLVADEDQRVWVVLSRAEAEPPVPEAGPGPRPRPDGPKTRRSRRKHPPPDRTPARPPPGRDGTVDPFGDD